MYGPGKERTARRKAEKSLCARIQGRATTIYQGTLAVVLDLYPRKARKAGQSMLQLSRHECNRGGVPKFDSTLYESFPIQVVKLLYGLGAW
jgi:hypothetical protein